MTGIDSVVLRQAIIHKVGNPTRGEELKLSAHALTLNDDIVRKLLTHYFLHSFNEAEQYHFTHISDVALNEVYAYISAIFDNPKTFDAQSALLAQFLYSKSTHAKVKEGELYVVQLGEVPFENEYVEAIGIFKSETRETFLKVFLHGQSLEVLAEDGININKLDKGCLVFKKNRSEGYVACITDATNKQNEAQYWVNDFLQVAPYADSYHNTNKAMGMCKLFIDGMNEQFVVNKSDKIDMLNRSLDYFKTKEQFNLGEFAEEVMYHPEVIDTFKEYKQTYEQAKGVQINDEFDIHLSAVKKSERVYKSILKLDKNFHIYIHGRKDLIERGYDEMKEKNFYKLYFDEES